MSAGVGALAALRCDGNDAGMIDRAKMLGERRTDRPHSPDWLATDFFEEVG
jgi:hypothetical protein